MSIFAAVILHFSRKSLKKGIVVKTTGSWHTVRSGDQVVNCRLKGNFRIREIKNTNPVAVGDQVTFELTGSNHGIITRIHERKNYIIRKATNLARETQILAANIDQVLLMITLEFPETPLEFVDRFLVTAEAYHVKTVLLINKTDLYGAEVLSRMDEVRNIYAYAGYTVVDLSVQEGLHMEQVRYLIEGKLNLIAGNSGVGKSTLINRLCPGLNLKTDAISSYHLSGKHTTTYPEMIAVSPDTYIIDSPGIRGFGLTDLERSEIGLYFTDIFRLSKDCHFYNCTHLHEPDCAVMKAVQQGILHASRYRSYRKLFMDSDQKYRIT